MYYMKQTQPKNLHPKALTGTHLEKSTEFTINVWITFLWPFKSILLFGIERLHLYTKSGNHEEKILSNK